MQHSSIAEKYSAILSCGIKQPPIFLAYVDSMEPEKGTENMVDFYIPSSGHSFYCISCKHWYNSQTCVEWPLSEEASTSYSLTEDG